MGWRRSARAVRTGLVALALVGCSGPVTMSVKPIDSYPFRQTQDRVKVAVDPLFSKERARNEFPGGEAFEEQNLLPVWVLIENGSQQAVRADRADFRLVRPNGQAEVALAVQDAFSQVKPPVGLWAALPILGPSAQAYRSSDWLKQFESRALKDTPIQPEGSAVGLIFFYFPEGDKNLAGTRVVFMVRTETGEPRNYEVALQGRRDIPGLDVQADPSSPASRAARTQQGTRVEGAGGGVIIRSPAP